VIYSAGGVFPKNERPFTLQLAPVDSDPSFPNRSPQPRWLEVTRYVFREEWIFGLESSAVCLNQNAPESRPHRGIASRMAKTCATHRDDMTNQSTAVPVKPFCENNSSLNIFS
jgi:hypothetical protein